MTASPTDAAEGDTVTLTVTPAEGYELDTLTVKDADGGDITVDADNKFTMPAKDVTVTATFKKIEYVIKSQLDGAIATLKALVDSNTASVAQINTALTEVNTLLSNLDITYVTHAELTEALNDINAVIGALDNTYATDAELAAAIATAKSEAVASAQTLVDNAKSELQSAIDQKADAATVNTAIANLQQAIDALEAVKDAYVDADNALRTELEGKMPQPRARRSHPHKLL